MDVKVEVTQGTTISDVEVSARVLARSVVLDDCFRLLSADPGGAPFIDKSGKITTGCDAKSMVLGSNDNVTQLPPSFSSPANCDVSMCRTQAALCVANRLLELSTAVAPVTFSSTIVPTGGTATSTVTAPADVVVGPQDEESAVALTEEALRYAAWAGILAGENLRNATGRRAPTPAIGKCTATDVASKTLDGRTFGRVFASSLVDATQLADEAGRAAVNVHCIGAS
jgi:hypothetical protein